MIKFNINIRSNRLNKLGLAPLFITITDDKIRVKKQLKLFCKPNEWLVQAQTLKASTKMNPNIKAQEMLNGVKLLCITA